jgi:uncharacterized GH25 family protein
MSRKIIFLLALIFTVSVSWQASAHDFWAGLGKADPGGRVVVFQGFGHNFPAADEITAEVFAERFEALKLVGANGEIQLEAGPNAYTFNSREALPAGSYYVAASSVVGFASRTPSGFVRKSKAEDSSATSCSFGGNFGKNLFTVDPAGDDSWIKKPLGQKLEIVPQANPETVAVGGRFPVVVYFDDKPRPGARVEAFFAGFTEDNSAAAFSAAADNDGQVDIIPLRPGQWLAKVSQTEPYSDPAACDRETYSASLAFTIKE